MTAYVSRVARDCHKLLHEILLADAREGCAHLSVLDALQDLADHQRWIAHDDCRLDEFVRSWRGHGLSLGCLLIASVILLSPFAASALVLQPQPLPSLHELGAVHSGS